MMQNKKTLSILLIFVLMLTLFPLQSVFADGQVSQDIEVLLTPGTSDMNITNFEEDLKTILAESYGVLAERVKITRAKATVEDVNVTVSDQTYLLGEPTDSVTDFTYQSSFLEYIKQQTWQDSSSRFIINLDNDGVPEFSDSNQLNEILSEMSNKDIHYLGWGLDSPVVGVTPEISNKSQAEQFIASNGVRGTFISQEGVVDPYTEGLAEIATYISENLIISPTTTPSTDSSEATAGGGASSGGAIGGPVVSGGAAGGGAVVSGPVVSGGAAGGGAVVSSGGVRFTIFEDPTFPEMVGHWAAYNVERMAFKEIIKGYPDGTFGAYKIVTRAEFAAMLARAFDFAKAENPNLFSEESSLVVEDFKDVAEVDWHYGLVARLAKDKIINGYGDGSFGPNKNITREEAAVIIARSLQKLNVELTDSALTFTDSEYISSWAKRPLGQIQNVEIILGLPDGTFNPAANTTRAEAAVMIYRMLEKIGLF